MQVALPNTLRKLPELGHQDNELTAGQRSMLVQITPAIARKLHYVLLTTVMR